MRVLALAVLALGLVACASVKPTNLPDGRDGYSISCRSLFLGMSACYEKAGETCRSKGYKIFEVPTVGKHLLISCRQ